MTDLLLGDQWHWYWHFFSHHTRTWDDGPLGFVWAVLVGAGWLVAGALVLFAALALVALVVDGLRNLGQRRPARR